jgi:hypothetical protein
MYERNDEMRKLAEIRFIATGLPLPKVIVPVDEIPYLPAMKGAQ